MKTASLFLAILVPLANAQSWQRTEKTDAFRGTQYSQFTLAGKFLTPPQHSSLDAPVIVLQCKAGNHGYGGHWHYDGKLIDAYIQTGATLNASLSSIAVQYRLDDGKIQTEDWTPSTNYGAIFFKDITLNTLLYGHFMPHKEGTNPPVRKLTVAVDEYLAGEVVMEFDLPDPTDPASVCGTLLKRD